VALLVLDGLSLDCWQVLRNAWQSKAQAWRCEESALFACLPTVTPIARQAIFAGQLPLYFGDTWNRTDADGQRWRRFWDDQGLFPSAVSWLRGTEGLEAALTDTRVRALGLVINAVDDMLHGTVGGLAELHHRVRLWAERGELAEAVERLLGAGFDVWLTRDHGCTATRGVGRPREGVLVEGRGTRVRFYTDPAFLARSHSDIPDALAWTPGGQPAGLLTLFVPGDAAFAVQDEQIITHDGLSLEEIIVPWVHNVSSRSTSACVCENRIHLDPITAGFSRAGPYGNSCPRKTAWTFSQKSLSCSCGVVKTSQRVSISAAGTYSGALLPKTIRDVSPRILWKP
jgi:hypothetical protein